MSPGEYSLRIVTDPKLPRVYVPDVAALGQAVELRPDEAAHLTRVLRLRAGAKLVAFDGRGGEFLAELGTRRGRRAIVIPLARTVASAEPSAHVVVAQALLKGRKMDDVIRDTVMLGAVAVQPLVTARTESLHAGRDPGRRVERWQRIAAASAGQSGRAVVPEIREPIRFDRYVAHPPAGLGVMLVEPIAGEIAAPVAFDAAPSVATLLVGPEGGWSRDEIAAAAAAGYRPWTLGQRTLRADVAALVGLSVLFARFGDL
jgi:16S rRNA (uracil1498-N3)-methyltransferase